jgi:IS30 family transposase
MPGEAADGTRTRGLLHGKQNASSMLDAVADELHERPRKRLEFANPTERLSELLLQ